MTIGSLGRAVAAIVKDGTREEAREFMDAYRAETIHAAANIGYMAGYHDPETARTIWDWFECAHPIFGTYVPTHEEAFDAGRRSMAGDTDGPPVPKPKRRRK